jgi:hypothetical protein
MPPSKASVGTSKQKTGAWLDAVTATEYGLRLRDGTLLTFDTARERDARQADFEEAEWSVTALVRQTRIQHTEWTEESA